MRQDPAPLPFSQEALTIATFEPGVYEVGANLRTHRRNCTPIDTISESTCQILRNNIAPDDPPGRYQSLRNPKHPAMRKTNEETGRDTLLCGV
jgi:hypothetical protein